LKFLLLSDLHLEFKFFLIPEMENEKDIVVVLAGDIGLIEKPWTYEDFIADTCDRFKKVIWILGNHEFYGGKFGTALSKLWNATLEHENLYVLDKESIVIDNVAFICATLWTNMDNHNQMTMYDAKNCMNDYKKIRNGPINEPWKRKLSPVNTVAEHLRAKEFIFAEIVAQKKAGNHTVVVSHHLPSFQSIPEEFRGDNLNGAYASELFEDIMDTQPDIWAHGHTHASSDYVIGITRVICNPRGYATNPADLNYDFNPNLVINV